MPIDWLHAIATGVKGIPGLGGFMAIPLDLRDQEKAAKRNAEINRMFEEGKEVSTSLLATIVELQDSSNETKAYLEMLTAVLRELFRANRDHVTPRTLPGIVRRDLATTQWPLPISKELLMEELEGLFTDVEVFSEALRLAGFPRPQAPRIGSAIADFADEVNRQPAEKRRAVFQRLSKGAEASNILRFLRDYTAEADSTSDLLRENPL